MFWITILMMMGVSFGSDNLVQKYSLDNNLSEEFANALTKVFLKREVMHQIYGDQSQSSSNRYLKLDQDEQLGLIITILSAFNKSAYNIVGGKFDKETYFKNVTIFFDYVYNVVTNTSTTPGRILRRLRPGYSELTKKIINIFVNYLRQQDSDLCNRFISHIKGTYQLNYETMDLPDLQRWGFTSPTVQTNQLVIGQVVPGPQQDSPTLMQRAANAASTVASAASPLIAAMPGRNMMPSPQTVQTIGSFVSSLK